MSFTYEISRSDLNALTTAAKAEAKSSNLRAELADKLHSQGVMADMLTAKHYKNLTTEEGQQRALKMFYAVQGAIAEGLLTASERKIWAQDHKTAKENGQSEARNQMTGRVAAYMASFRNQLKTRESDGGSSTGKATRAPRQPEGAKDDKAPTIDAKDTDALAKTLKNVVLQVSGSKDKDIESIRAQLLELLNAAEALVTNAGKDEQRKAA